MLAAATDAWPEPRDWRDHTRDEPGDRPVRDDGAATGVERTDPEPPQLPDGYEPI